MSALTVTPTPDAEIVERPDEEAASLFALHRRRIRDYCYGQLHDRQDAEDALQATFLYAFTLMRSGTKPTRPLPWLYTIAHNVCRTRRRALNRRRQVESAVDLETLHDSVGRNDAPRDEVAELATSLTALPRMQRDALLLREWQGLSYAEIAAQLGLTETAVEAVLFRARRNLARTLRPVGERVASIVNGAFLLSALRRVASFGGSAKAGAAVLLAGTAAATTLLPLAAAPVRRAAAPRVASHLVRPRTSPPQTVPTAPRPRIEAPHAVPPRQAAGPAASAPAVPPVPTPAAATPSNADTATPPARRPPAVSAPAPPTAPTSSAPASVPVDTLASAAQSPTDTATDTLATTATVVSDVQSTVQATASTAQSTLSTVARQAVMGASGSDLQQAVRTATSTVTNAVTQLPPLGS